MASPGRRTASPSQRTAGPSEPDGQSRPADGQSRPADGQGQAGTFPALPVRPWLVPRQLPAAPAQFIDRAAELAKLDELIGQDAEPGGEARVRAVVGSPGIGKSALAAVWAHRAAGHFPDGQLYVNLKGFGPAARPVLPEQAIRGFLQALRVGCYRTARSHLLRASSLFGEAGATAWQARNHLTLGVLFDRQGRHDKARRQAERALSLYQDLGYRAGEAHALENLGWHLAMLGSGQDAVDHCRRALDLNREVGNLVGEAHAWDHLGYAMHLVGDDAEAIACYRRALKLLREVRDRAEQGGVLARLGDIYSSVGNKAVAKAVWRRALAILEELHDLGADEVRSRLGVAPGAAVPGVC
jgi:tetratricopeptide (TPR) repeat protein